MKKRKKKQDQFPTFRKFFPWLLRLAGALLALPLALLGSANIELDKKGKAKLPAPRVKRRAVYSLLMGVFLISLPGLLVGNLPRMKAVWSLLPLVALLLVFALVIAIFLWPYRRYVKLTCAKCGRKAFRHRPTVSFRSVFLKSRVCRKCGCEMTQEGREIAYSGRLPLGALVKPMALVSAVTLVAFLAGFLGGVYLWDSVGKMAVDRAVQSWEDAGYSLEMPKNTPKPRDDDNAAYWIDKAGAAVTLAIARTRHRGDKVIFKQEDESGLISDFLGKVEREGFTSEELAVVRGIVNKNSQVLAYLRKASLAKKTHWGIEWQEEIWRTEIPEYRNIMNLARLTACRAIVAASDGDTAEAIAAVSDGLALAQATGEPPLLLSQMIGVAVYRIALNAARFVLPRVSAAQAGDSWLPYGDGDAIKRGYKAAVAGEHGWVLRLKAKHMGEVMDSFTCTGESCTRISLPERMLGSLYAPFLRLDVASHVRLGLVHRRALDLPYSEHVKALEDYEKRIDRDAWLFCAISMPRWGRMYDRILEATTGWCLLQAVLGAHEFKQAKGRWPESTKELGPPCGDPFSARPLRLKKSGRGIMIYSIGPDLEDENGESWDRFEGTGDISWVLE